MAVINPYVNFNGNCEEAFNFYKSVFGGEFATLMRFKDLPFEGSSASEAEKIMHVALPIGQGTILMGSDVPDSMGKVTSGNNFSLAIGPASEEEARRLFNDLAAGGKVNMPLDWAPWGDLYGDLTDKFGIHWLVNYSKQ